MIRVVVLAHLLGSVMWLGGAFASMVVGAASRREAPDLFAVVARLQGAITRRIVAPGAAIALLSGLWLTADRYPGAAMAQASPWLFVMQAAGFVGALVVLLAALPTAAKLSRIDAHGDTGPLFLLLRKLQSIVSSIAGTLALVALIAAVML